MVPSFIELSSDLLREMIRKSGVVAWESDNETIDAMVNAANRMAAQLLGAEMPTAFYYKTGTPIVFGSEAGDDVDWSTESIAAAAGQQSALHDQGVDGTARPAFWRYRFYTQCQATPAVGKAIALYLKTSDGTHLDNDDGVGDLAVSSINKLLNLWPLAPAIVDEAAANIEFVSKGSVLILPRYFGVVLWNPSGNATITTDVSETKAVFTPYYVESQ